MEFNWWRNRLSRFCTTKWYGNSILGYNKYGYSSAWIVFGRIISGDEANVQTSPASG